MSSFLITGSAGFIGFHTALSLQNEKVIGLDNFNDYYSVSLKRKRADMLKSRGIDVIEGDILDRDLLKKIIAEKKITHIIHLAAQAGVRYSLKNPETYVRNNIDGFLSILETVRQNSHIKVIYASSSSVYGLNENLPYSESDRTDKQASLYGVTKKTNELMAQAYHHMFDLDLVGLRFFTVYGPWGRPDMAYFDFTRKILEGEEISVFNKGNCYRDFTYIDDITLGIRNAAKLPKGNYLFNLGNHKPVKVIEFIEILEKLIGKKAKKKWLPMQPGDVEKTFAQIDAAKKHLDFRPEYSLEKGLKNFLSWYKDFYQNNR